MLWTRSSAPGNPSQNRRMKLLDGREGSDGNSQGLPFFVYVANLSAKAVSPQKHMIVPSANNAFPHIIHAQKSESDMLDEPKLENKTHANTREQRVSAMK